MAADYKVLDLDSNLYKQNSSALPRLTAADLETMFADSEFLSSKISSITSGQITSGQFQQGQTMVYTNGTYRIMKIGRLS